MPYLQITTVCNFSCAHCCYNCTKHGRHMKMNTVRDAIKFFSEIDSIITIGGGEPTLHPNFFEILELCMDEIDHVWMATNGSQTKMMHRLANIINDCDYESFDCKCDESEKDWCRCADGMIRNPDYKLAVALSTDHWHDPIDHRIRQLWERRANSHEYSHFELRDVSRSYRGAMNVGRAAITGVGQYEDCVCPTLLIKPSGIIKACGCPNSPTVGDVVTGIYPKYASILESDDFRDVECWSKYKGKF